MKIKNYNSTGSLSDYNAGDVFVFYVHNSNSTPLYRAEVEIIEKYSPVFTQINNLGIYNENDGKWLSFTRVLGVVVDKHEAVNSNDIDTITVMFQTNHGDFVLKKYVVNTSSVFTNEKDLVPPSTVLCTV